ncbi:MAG: hypothetical protein ACK58T_28970, partial [Phycisphaerae bacterium]
MPLVSISEYGQVEPDDSGSISIVVFNDGRRNVGVVVGRIVDIVNDSQDITSQISGSVDDSTRIIAGRVTRVVDLSHLAMMA